MALTQFILKEERQRQSALINAMAQAVYGTAEDRISNDLMINKI